MQHIFIKQSITAISFLFLMSVVLGLLYPGIVTGLAQILFPYHANGSLLKKGHIIKGSALIGQNFQEKKYFWGRPSETIPYPYNSLASNGSNLSLTNPILIKKFKHRLDILKQAHSPHNSVLPIDLVTASASGLDPHISPEAARFQSDRITHTRGISKKKVLELIEKNTIPRQFGFLGEPCVNVLELNIALDNIK